MNAADAPEALLAHLVGAWTLTGRMGATSLEQDVTAKWTLRENYLEMHFLQSISSVPPNGNRYEALYVIGYEPATGQYFLHLFDIFGPGFSKTIGVGTRQGNSIRFEFRYSGGLLANTFTWEPEFGKWRMLLQEQDKSGNWAEFAVKTLDRE